MNAHAPIASLGQLSRMCIMFLACQFANGQELPKNRADLLNLSQQNQDVLMRRLRPALKTNARAARLYVHSKCLGASGDILFFPRIELNSGSKEKTGFPAIHRVLAGNKGIRVAERQPGLVGIWVGDVSDGLLNTKIHVLKFGSRQRYNYYDAIEAIIGTKEVQAKMRELQIDELTSFASYPMLSPDPKLRHLPLLLTNLTMDQALDQVALAFGGAVIFRECNGQNPRHYFSIDFDAIAETPFEEGH